MMVRHMIIRYIKRILYTLFISLILLISTLAFFLTTNTGLHTAIHLANLLVPGTIKYQKLHGRLIDKLSFETLSYDDQAFHLEFKKGQLQLKLNALLNKKLIIKHLRAKTLHVTLKSLPETTTPEPESPSFSLPTLPLAIEIRQLSLNVLQLTDTETTHTIKHLTLQAFFHESRWVIESLKGSFQHTHFNAHAHLKPQAPYPLSARLELRTQSGNQSLQGVLKLGGTLALYHVQGELSEPFKATMHGTLHHGKTLHFKTEWHEAAWPFNKTQTFSSPEGALSINGDWQHLTFQAHAQIDAPLKANVKADFSGNSLQTLTGSAILTADYKTHPIKATINVLQSRFNAILTLGSNTLELSGIPPYTWEGKADLPQPNLIHPALSGLKTSISATFKLLDAHQGTLSCSIKPGVYQTNDTHLPPLHFEGGEFTADLTQTGLSTQGQFVIDHHKKLTMNAMLPGFRLDNLDPNQPLNSTLSLEIDSLSFLDKLSPHIEKTDGKLTLNLSATGALNQPDIEGEALLEAARIYLPALNLNLNPIAMTLKTKAKQWLAAGSVVSQGQRLTLEGEGAFSPELSGLLRLKGDTFPLMQTAEYHIWVTPELALQFQPGSFDLKGQVLIPKATLKPMSFSNSVDLTDDAVFVSDKKDKSPLNFSMDVAFKTGDKVELDVKGLHGFLKGDVDVRKTPDSEPYAVGELKIQNGQYKAYGQQLVIEEGQLLFTGGSIRNPGIRIRAIRRFKNTTSDLASSERLFDFSAGHVQSMNLGTNTTVGIEVSGRINSPKVKLFSIPPNLSQADILSMLILGKPASQASHSGGQLLLNAVSAMNLDSGTKGFQMLEQLKQTLGFDFNIQNASQYDQNTNEVNEHTSLTIGKAITNRIYVSYNTGLFQENSDVFTLKYMLNKFFSIQVSASDSASGIDLFYTRSQD